MLIKVLFTLTITVICFAQKQTADEPVPILHYDNEGVNHDGSYKFSYKTGDGIQAEQSGFLRQLEGRKEEFKAQVMEGSYSYTGPDGVVYTVNYIADETGFRAVGAHLPSNLPQSSARSQGPQNPIPAEPPRPPATLPSTPPMPSTTEGPPVGVFPPVRVG